MQETLVVLIVTVATVAVVRRYTPAPLRRACRAAAARFARRLGWHSLERRLSAPAAAEASCADGCGPCQGCSPEAIPKNRFTVSLDELRNSAKR